MIFGLSVMQVGQLALQVLKLFNWLAEKVDEATWKKIGATEENARLLKLHDDQLIRIDKAIAEARAATPEERAKSLDQDL